VVKIHELDHYWSLDILNPPKSKISLPFPDTLSELTKLKSNIRSRKTPGLRQALDFAAKTAAWTKLGQKHALVDSKP
jgi:hypothetical protein